MERHWAVPLVELGVAATAFTVAVGAEKLYGFPGCAMSCGGSQTALWTSYVAGNVGILFASLALADAIRSRRFVEEVPSLETQSLPGWCGEQPAANQTLSVMLPDGPVPLALDSVGVGRLELPLAARVAGLSLAASMDGRRIAIEVPEDRCAASR